MEPVLYNACSMNDLQKVTSILAEHPDVNVNWLCHDTGRSALHEACFSNYPHIVWCLMNHPGIDLNVKGKDGKTPIFSASRGIICFEALYLMVGDSRVDMCGDRSPLEYAINMAVYSGLIDPIKNIIACGRAVMDLGPVGMASTARKLNHIPVANLLEKYATHPAKVRQELILELGYYRAAPDIFSLVIFQCDGYTAFSDDAKNDPRYRFFRLAGMLPAELQMMLCNRVGGRTKDTIAQAEVDLALGRLAKVYKTE